MDTANDLLDKVKAACNFPSDNVLAQKIGLTRAMVSSWRHGRHPIPDERIAQMCALAKLDGPTWIAMLHAERAQTATERALWRLMLDRLSAAAAVVALVALSLPSIGNAKTAQNQAVSGGLLTHSVYYVRMRPDRTSGLAAIYFSFVSLQDLSEKPLRRTTFSAISYRRYQSEPSSPATGHDKPATR